MEEEHNKDLLDKLVKDEPQAIISTSPADFSISVRGSDDTNHVYVYPQSTPIETMAMNTAADMEIQISPKERKELFQAIEELQDTYVSKTKIKLAGFELEIERAPKKIIKSYKKTKGSE